MEIEHFSHRHPLTYIEEGRKDGRFVICNGCEEAVVGPRYTCNQCVNPFFPYNLHKTCAELPREIRHPVHFKHPLKLQCYKDPFTVYTCDSCDQPCRLAYTCSDCDLSLDIKCASSWRVILEDRRHVHQFTVLRKKIPFNCDICGGTWDSVSYLCTVCHLLVDKACAHSLPHRIRITAHEHRLTLIWYLEDAYPRDQFCKICYTTTDRSRAVYYCRRCGYVADTLCAFEEITDTFDDDNDDDDDDLILGQEQWNMEDDQTEPAAQQINHFSHDQHFLVLSDEVKDLNGTITCDGCMRPITMSTGAFYSCCAEQEQCCFYLHKTCAHLPRTRLHPLHRHHLTLLSAAPSFDRVFKCHMCRSLSQGFSYYCDKCDLYLDLQCISVSNPLTHDAHRHPLFFNFHPYKEDCKGCGISLTEVRFSCIKCNFHLCVACVKLPPTARYKYHNDPLKLTYHAVENELGECYCEICEGERDPTHWFYSYADCEFDCHPHCLLGRYPQVKLGSSYKHNAHPHPVNLVDKRKSAIPFDKRESILDCQACGEPCEGLVFECAECNINIHREGNCNSLSKEEQENTSLI